MYNKSDKIMANMREEKPLFWYGHFRWMNKGNAGMDIDRIHEKKQTYKLDG